MTQISNMKVIGLMVDFLKIIKLWHLSIEFYGVWQKVALPTLKPHPQKKVYRYKGELYYNVYIICCLFFF